MNKQKTLSGFELVSKGSIKIGVSLPESGLKDVLPNGSWLEKKQIQAALEARKHLIETERIEKIGVLSHAIWKEDLLLAVVTQKVGGHWQYFGHNKGKDLFLHPEEALFLMEINCLLLLHNDVKVSLQQAYTLLLRGKTSLLKYKVYASLSRLGYRVFRHDLVESDKKSYANKETKSKINKDIDRKCNNDGVLEGDSTYVNDESQEECSIESNKDELIKTVDSLVSNENIVKNKEKHGVVKLEKLNRRKVKPCNSEKLHENFIFIPDVLNKTWVTCTVADRKYLPINLNLSKSEYCIDLKKMYSKNTQTALETNRYSPNDEVNGSHIQRLRNSSYRCPYTNVLSHSFPFQSFSRSTLFHRAHQNLNFININTLLQRSFPPDMVFVPAMQFLLRSSTYSRPQCLNRNFRNIKRNQDDAQTTHLESIKNLTIRLKNLYQMGTCQQHNIDALQRLIQTYNTRYEKNVRLSDELELIVENIVDTIYLDDDEPVEKKRCLNDKTSLRSENLKALKDFVIQLKSLEKEGKSSARHRRAVSKLLKTFNQSYNEEYYITKTYELANKRHITLDSSDSSHSDCITEGVSEFPVGKKLKNPFNVLKRLSGNQGQSSEASTSRTENVLPTENNISSQYSLELLSTFSAEWLPKCDDFGRAEVVRKNTEDDFSADLRQEEFLYDFMKVSPCLSNNWLELKKSYYSSINRAVEEFRDSIDYSMDIKINSIVKPKDCSNLTTVLKKLSIIKSEKRVNTECSLELDFDAYNRGVQNFRKTQPPLPHFRIICFSAHSNMPPGEDIAALKSKYNDNVPIVYAIVDDSVSYIQVKPTELPVYISES